MRILRRRPTGADANEIAMHSVTHSWGGRITAIGTVVALVFSGFSLWETSLKRVFTSKGKVDVTLKLINPALSGWLDRIFSTPVVPVTLTLEIPDLGERKLENELIRLRTVTGGS